MDSVLEERFKARMERKEVLSIRYHQVKSGQKAWEEAGVTRVIWVTRRDERVRPEHEALDGTEIPIGGHPTEGFPGEQPGCRCEAEPVRP